MWCFSLFMVSAALELFSEISEENAMEFMDSKKDIIWFFFSPKEVAAEVAKYKGTITAVAAEQKERLFVYLDSSKHPEHATESFGCHGYPCITLMKFIDVESQEDDAEKLYSKTFEGELSKEDITSFISDAYAGKIPAVKHDKDDL